LKPELKFFLVVSDVIISPISHKSDKADNISAGVEVVIKSSDNAKCDRCWHHSETVGISKSDPKLCNRCVATVSGDDELRFFT
jgi:isoleucyl-tRNA synthetase